MRIILLCVLIFQITGSNAQIHSARMQAAGLTCALCSNAIYQALLNLSFVQEVTPDLQHSSFLIQFKDSVALDPEAIRSKVDAAGFSVAELSFITNQKTLNLRIRDTLNVQGLTFYFLNEIPLADNDSVFIKLVSKGYLTEKGYKQYAGKLESILKTSGRQLQSGQFYAIIESINR